MKKAFMFSMFIVLIVTAFAQTGMYGIKFGAPVKEMDKQLRGSGFKIKESSESSTTYTNSTLPSLISLELRDSSSNDSVSGWTIKYDIEKDEKVQTNVLAKLKELHGEHDVSDDYDCDYIWYFPNDHALYVTVYPTNIELNYTIGNWDDDEYYYYEDYWW